MAERPMLKKPNSFSPGRQSQQAGIPTGLGKILRLPAPSHFHDGDGVFLFGQAGAETLPPKPEPTMM